MVHANSFYNSLRTWYMPIILSQSNTSSFPNNITSTGSIYNVIRFSDNPKYNVTPFICHCRQFDIELVSLYDLLFYMSLSYRMISILSAADWRNLPSRRLGVTGKLPFSINLFNVLIARVVSTRCT